MTVELSREEIIDIISHLTLFEYCPSFKNILSLGLGHKGSIPGPIDLHCSSTIISWDKKAKKWDWFTDEQLWAFYQRLKPYHDKIM